MHDWLVAITNGTVLVIDAIVLVIIAVGTIQAFVQGLRVMLLPDMKGETCGCTMRAGWSPASPSSSPPISLRPQSLRAGTSWCASRPSQRFELCSTSSSREISPRFAGGNSSL